MLISLGPMFSGRAILHYFFCISEAFLFLNGSGSKHADKHLLLWQEKAKRVN